MHYIEVEQLNKSFTVRKKREKGHLMREKNVIHALQDVSFHIDEGELTGYIGPNGAGKSTSVKILSGILTPDSGKATVGGLIPWTERKKHVQNIGVVFGQRMQLWWDVPILDSYRLLKDIYKVDKNDFESRLEELTDALDLKKLMSTPLRLMSLGQRMRAELCGSLLHSPKLLFLDEPTIGLDAVSKLKLREFLQKENKEKGTTILLTTHDMEDIAALCNRVMVLGHGKKLFDGQLPELLSRYDTQRTIHVRYNEEPDFANLPANCALQKEGDTYIITYAPAQLPTAEIIARLQQAGRMQEMTAQSQNIDHLIARMYREMDL